MLENTHECDPVTGSCACLAGWQGQNCQLGETYNFFLCRMLWLFEKKNVFKYYVHDFICKLVLDIQLLNSSLGMSDRPGTTEPPSVLTVSKCRTVIKFVRGVEDQIIS